MSESPTFRERAFAAVGDKEIVMLNVGQSIESAEFDGTLDDARRQAVQFVLEAISHPMKRALSGMIAKLAETVGDEYELFEGPPPDENGASADAWWAGLHAKTADAFDEDIKAILGADLPEIVSGVAFPGSMAAPLVSAFLAKPSEVLTTFGVTTDDIEALAATLHGKAPVKERANKKNGRRREDPTRSRQRAPTVNESTAITDSSRAALEALMEHASVRDVDIAEALGVSRSHALNYRKGATLLDPTDAQIGAIEAMFKTRIDALSAAFQTFNDAMMR